MNIKTIKIIKMEKILIKLIRVNLETIHKI